MLLGASKNYLRLYQIDDIFSLERPIWQDKSDGDDSWRYGQVSVSGVTQYQVNKSSLDLTMGLAQHTVTYGTTHMHGRWPATLADIQTNKYAGFTG